MSTFAKKYPFLFGIFVVSIIIFLACVVSYVITSGANDKKEKRLSSLVKQYNNLKNSSPTPLPQNIDKVNQNVEQLEQNLEEMYESLLSKTSAITDQSMRGISLLGEIQGFIIDSEKAARRAYRDEKGKRQSINLKENEAFGFAQYSGGSATPPPDDIAPIVNKQLDILKFLVKNLYESKPKAIVSIEREPVSKSAIVEDEERNSRRDNTGPGEDLFIVPASITAAVPGSIETTGFKIVFQGYTDSLRKYLNLIAGFELPIVVREVEVKSIGAGAEIGSNSSRRSRRNNNQNVFNELFGGPSTPQENGTNQDVSSQFVPIVEDIVSQFSITLEYIDVVDSSEEAEEEEEF